jgi:hypothetical protein
VQEAQAAPRRARLASLLALPRAETVDESPTAPVASLAE